MRFLRKLLVPVVGSLVAVFCWWKMPIQPRLTVPLVPEWQYLIWSMDGKLIAITAGGRQVWNVLTQEELAVERVSCGSVYNFDLMCLSPEPVAPMLLMLPHLKHAPTQAGQLLTQIGNTITITSVSCDFSRAAAGPAGVRFPNTYSPDGCSVAEFCGRLEIPLFARLGILPWSTLMLKGVMVSDVSTETEFGFFENTFNPLFSPDGKTLALVATPDVEGKEVHLYDFPLHKPWLRISAYALLASTLAFVAGQLVVWRRRR